MAKGSDEKKERKLCPALETVDPARWFILHENIRFGKGQRRKERKTLCPALETVDPARRFIPHEYHHFHTILYLPKVLIHLKCDIPFLPFNMF